MDPDSGRRSFDLSGGAEWPDEERALTRCRLAAEESAGERLRLLYVAMTRAQHQTVVWWAQAKRSGESALAHVLFARRGAAIDPEAFGKARVPVPTDREALAHFDPLVAAARGTVAVEVVGEAPIRPERWTPPTGDRPEPELGLATWSRLPDRSRQRWSFSAIVDRASVGRFDPLDASMADRGAGDEQDRAGPDDEAGRPGSTPRSTGGGAVAGSLADLPAGTAFGTMVHAVLEEVDFASDRLAEELEEAVERQLRWRSVDLTPVIPAGASDEQGRALLVDGLRAAIQTPLGGVCGGLRLADIGPLDRLTEVSFDLRLADHGPPVSMEGFGAVVLDHLGADDPLTGWATGLTEGAIGATVAGHLTGSIDLVLRIPGGTVGPRFVVADYKTNALHLRGQPPGPADYGADRLVSAMEEHDYPLQALVYSVALHRYLRWRMPGYRPEAHLGGVAYLFLRGMTGHGGGAGAAAGVFEWAVPPALVAELSDLLDGRGAGGRVA